MGGLPNALASHRWLVVVVSVVGVLVIGCLDWAAGQGVRLSVAYIAPVGVAAWYMGRWPGIGMCLFSSLVINVTESLAGGANITSAVFLINVPLVMAFFMVVVAIIERLHAELLLEQDLARLDALTGVANGRQFRETAELEIARARRGGSSLSLLYLDVDDFKSINDVHGHECGDDLLRAVAGQVGSALRVTDVVARIGGDEFVVLLPDTGSEAAVAVAQKLVAALPTKANGSCADVSLSIGAATFPEVPDSVETLLQVADEAMYEVKRSGKAGLLHVTGDRHDAIAADRPNDRIATQ